MSYCGEAGCACVTPYRPPAPFERGQVNTLQRVKRYLERALRKHVPSANLRISCWPPDPRCQLLSIGERQVLVRIGDGSVFLFTSAFAFEHFPFPKRTRGRLAAETLLERIVPVAVLAAQRKAAEVRTAAARERQRQADIDARERQHRESVRTLLLQKQQCAYAEVLNRLGVLDSSVRLDIDEHGARMQVGARLTPVQVEIALAALIKAGVLVTATTIPVSKED